jgi:hypothetical protein
MQRPRYCFVIPFLVFLVLLQIHAKDYKTETKIYALHFPQFHEDPINNKLWGKGYTDWDNLKKAPLFNRYNRTIPRPHDSIGFYDLEKLKTRQNQAQMAKKYGVDGFIYHHYWFHHKDSIATLATPLEKMLIDGEPNISFAFNWAMESWTGTWHGRWNQGQMLYEQFCPSSADQRIVDHYNYLKQFFHHENYIKINGAPLFFVLRPSKNKCFSILTKLRELARADGFPSPGLYIPGGSNAMIHHEAYTGKLSHPPYHISHYDADFFYPYSSVPNKQMTIPSQCRNGSFSWKKQKRVQYLSTMVQFDNTPRRNSSHSLVWDRSFFNALGAAKSFELDLVTILTYDRCCQKEEIRSTGGKFVVINAWNEWAEGMALEPSKEFGFQFLESVKKAKEVSRRTTNKCEWSVYDKYFQDSYQYRNHSLIQPDSYQLKQDH